MPKSNVEFWQHKIQTNIERDSTINCKLIEMGWTVRIVWECELRTINLREQTLANLYEKITCVP